ncbi:conserved hypothetical protein [Ricinus communis]|uniref:Uncharacterized protein n=1 Tax=Ricinus communis TaxID=3988 RepID=B9S032_RICCO|nr:conserved hypothetical protein [Ricinus communis]
MVEVWLELMIFQTVNLKGRIPRDRSHKWILYQAGILLNACPRQFRLNFSAFIDMLKEQQCRLTTLCQGTNVQQGREYWYLLICNSIQMSATS